jgi:hypothetical protein
MMIEIVVDGDKLRRFHRLLKDRLICAFPGAGVALRAGEGGGAQPAAVSLLLRFERLIYRRGRETICDLLPAAAFDLASGGADIVIDFSSNPSRVDPGVLSLRPLFDNDGAESALIGALVAGRAPQIAIENASTGETVATGLPSLEAADGLIGGMEAVYSRAIVLIEQAIRDPRRSAPRPRFETRTVSEAEIVRAALANLARNAARMLYHLTCYAPHWRVGWRFNDGPGVTDLGRLDGPTWRVLPDRGYDSFADPFPFVWRGRSCLFFESLDHRVGKGVISTIEFGPDGPIGEPTPVIEEPWHLSYPFLIEVEGQLWMIPESSGSGKVPLYRCVEFPYRWERRDPLLEGIEAADPTIFTQNGRYYMTSVVRDGLGGYSDTLAIHHAARLFGPWLPHAARPVLVDARAARPAGAVIERSGVLWRPVQDCSRGYGRALRLARIDRIDPENFEQTFTSEIGSGPLWPGGRLHTVNRIGRLETIDGVAVTPKLSILRRLAASRTEPQGGASSAGSGAASPPTASRPARGGVWIN